jgi:glycine hydroxymethyltransferase
VGTPAITTRGVKEDTIIEIVDLIDQIISDIENENLIHVVKKQINTLMENRPLFTW